LYKTPLSTASELVMQLGPQAEMLAGDHAEAALAANNQEDFEHWSLVAKAIVLLTRQPVPADNSRPASATTSQPAEQPALIPWRARA
jgi:hypothetical protein